MTPIESGTTTRSIGPYPWTHEEPPGTAGTGPSPPAPEPDQTPSAPPADGGGHPLPPEPAAARQADGRRAVRAARRHRRRLSIGCVVLVAVCLGITIAVLGFARDRRPGALAAVSGARSAPAAVVLHPESTIRSTETLGASAPQGGHR